MLNTGTVTTPIRILIVEDRPDDAELMVDALRRSSFEPSWKRVDTEAEYLTELQTSPDVILADHTLPQFSAARALELLNESGRDIPLIVVTAGISEEVAVERIKQGAADYILKDRLTRLGAAVERAAEEKRLREEKAGAETAFREIQARTRAILDSALDCIVSMDHRGRIVEFNPAAENGHGHGAAGPRRKFRLTPRPSAGSGRP
jgi:DNA-binding NtrC family response regulator